MAQSYKRANEEGTAVSGKMGKIIRAYGWEESDEQRFLTINALADEVSIYQTIHNPVSIRVSMLMLCVMGNELTPL